ncbi:MAG: hypothetical protein A2X08_13195 [Bacteroidetes bacterium GWA2_32_17]|nr:MAG: hypothetical protein A2X08_13195 [Bacteroidetes bacterium GWA2_32_17]
MEEKKTITRKEFLANSSKIALGAVVGVAGINLLTGNKAFAETKEIQAWPYPWATLDPVIVRQNAHALYWNGQDCASGVFGALVQALDTAIGAPWTGFPIEVMLFGRGGGVSWGSLCGTLNGGAALISLVVDKTNSVALINELWGWYTTENLPSTAGNSAMYVDHPEIGVLPQNVAGSPLCHPSVSQWCFASSFTVTSNERKERCGRIAGDIAAKTVEILNAYFASTFVATFTDPAGNATCMGCHSTNVMTHMTCATCHTQTGYPHTAVAELGGSPSGFEIENAYPNPFFNSTKINFSVPTSSKIRLEIYDMKGQLVNSLIDSEVMNTGVYEYEWNGTNNSGNEVAGGIYFARLTSGNFMKTVKINFAK